MTILSEQEQEDFLDGMRKRTGITSEKKAAAVLAMAKSRTGAAEVRKYVPAQMTFWPEDRRAIANELARSALFQCGDNRKPRQYFDNVELFMLGEGAITYKGEELRSRDEDMFITLAHCARELPSGQMLVKVTSSMICKLNDWPQDQRYYNDIYSSIQRMKGGVITVFSRRLAKALKCQRALENGASEAELERLHDELAAFEKSVAADLPLDKDGDEIAGMMLSLISGDPVFTGAKSIKKGIPQGSLSWEIGLDKKLVSLFAQPYLTFMDRKARKELSGTGKRLQAYFLSHRDPYPVLLRSLEKFLGMNYKELKTLKYKITEELESLKNENVLEDYTFTKSADGSDWKVKVKRKFEKPEDSAQNE